MYYQSWVYIRAEVVVDIHTAKQGMWKKTVFTRLIWMGCGKGQPRVTTQNSGAPWKNNNMYDQEKTPYNPNDLQVSHLYNVSICDTEVKTVDSETCGFTYISFVSIPLELRQSG